jgi:hypothetical protein
MCALAPNILDALKIVKPETVLRWHRAGFRAYWRWKSRPRGGRPSTPAEIRDLIREMSIANPLWGAPRIHGELLKLGIDVGQTTVAKYMAKTRRRPPSQAWKTFLVNHADAIAAMDLFVVPTISFRLSYGFLILLHARQELLWLGVTAHRPPNGLRSRSPRRLAGGMRRDTWSVIGTVFTAPDSFSACGRWAFGIGRSHHTRHGKMVVRRGSSARSDVIASTMSLSSASRIFAICCVRIKGITMRGELICPYAKTRRSHAPSRPAAISSSRPFWADCTINTGGCELPTGTGIGSRLLDAENNLGTGGLFGGMCWAVTERIYDRWLIAVLTTLTIRLS